MTAKQFDPYPVLCTGGTYAVRFIDRSGNVRNYSFGCRERDEAVIVAKHLKGIIDAHRQDAVVPSGAHAWLSTLAPAHREKLAKLDVIDRSRIAAMDPLAQHFEAWADEFRARQPRRADDVLAILKGFAKAAGVTRLSDITLRLANRVFGQMAKAGDKPTTIRKRQQVLKQFCGWAVVQELLPVNPLAEMTGVSGGVERERRAMEVEEQEYLLDYTARAGEMVWHDRDGRVRCCVSGAERALVYQLVLETGLRSGETRTLTKSSFRLKQKVDGKLVNLLNLKASDEKNREGSTLRLRPTLAARIGEHLAHKLPAARAFDMPKSDETADMLRADMAAARAEWLNAAASPAEREEREQSVFLRDVDDRGAVVDFHALRVTFITNMARGGVPLSQAVKLARHSDPKLTIGIYTKLLGSDTEDALAKLPDLGPRLTLAGATGTHG
jgi:integrase